MATNKARERVRRLASRELKTGMGRIWLDNTRTSEISPITTKKQIREAIESGLIMAKPAKYNSRAKARARAEGKKSGRGNGPGSKKGTKNARLPARDIWISRIRAQRAELKKMVKSGSLSIEERRDMRQKAKGNFFKSVGVMTDYIAKKQAADKRQRELLAQSNALKMQRN